MTLVQLEYVLAVDTYRHFATAAQHCFVTQPTLSMQLQKLEEELGVMLFDRSRVPVRPTEVGQEVIAQARVVLGEARRIPEIIQGQKNELAGELRVGVIPTLAPYLIPLFITNFIQKYPGIRVVVQELLTDQIVEKLTHELLDVGLLVTPLENQEIREMPLFQEAFVAFVHPDHPLFLQAEIGVEELQLGDLWVLNEGHCFRSQVLQICSPGLRQKRRETMQFDYESGSLETLKRIVQTQKGLTLLPELSILDLSPRQQQLVRPLRERPLREVSIVVHRSYLKKRLIEVLREEIMAAIPNTIKERAKEEVVKVV
jgi:LysR family transcriptional regulator, hydrogen peroxide-inducible genes activator